jgi:ABC-type lipoprotein release transport system permease subunit
MTLWNLFPLIGRNIWRHPKRSLLTGLVIAVGVAAMILTQGLTDGMLQVMVKKSTQTFLGEFKVYHHQFRDEQAIEHIIPDAHQVRSLVADTPEVKASTARAFTQAMLASAEDMAAVTLYGVEPKTESRISKLKDAMIEGTYLGANEPYQILLGSKLATRLQVQVGDRLVITTSSAFDGELKQELFRLSGIFQFNQPGLDEAAAFITLNRMQGLLNLNDSFHELIVQFDELVQADGAPAQRLRQRLKRLNPDLVARSWRQELPALQAMLDMSQYSLTIVGLILFFMIALSVMNSMFMTIFERFYEFGVLQALGTRPFQLFALILLESSYIGLLGCITGAIGGGIANYILSFSGINYSDMELMGVSFSEPIRSIFMWQDIVLVPLSIWALTTLISVYPAYHAIRKKPIDAMRAQ